MDYKKKTKTGQEITIRIFQIDEEIQKSRLFDTFVFQALIKNEVVGYAKLTYINETNSQKLKEPFDYFIYKLYASDEKTISFYENKDYKNLLIKIGLKDSNLTKEDVEQLSKKELEETFYIFKNKINQTYENQFKYFYDYWVNKPNIELIKVFSEKDDKYTDFFLNGHPLIERKETKNWQGQNIGAALYDVCIQWCQSKNLSLWASTTQTEDAKRMWKNMEKLPKFTLMVTELFKYGQDGQVIQKISRPKINLT